jgi:hypothetical protein
MKDQTVYWSPMMHLTRLTALASVFVSAAAIAQLAPPAGPVTPVPEKKICRSEVPLGSIMSKRTCHTKSEWAAIRAKDNAAAAAALDRSPPSTGMTQGTN